MLWLMMACSGGEVDDSGEDEVACEALDTIAVAAYEIDDDGTIWLDGTGSTACDEALYSWWEVTHYEASVGGVQPDPATADYYVNVSEEAIYTEFDAATWAGEDVRVMLSICTEPRQGSCYGAERLGFDYVEFTVPE